MPTPSHPETALLDFQAEVSPLMYAVDVIEEMTWDQDVPPEIQVVCEAARQLHERATKALEDAVRWSESQVLLENTGKALRKTS